jgi:hypothetical protein
VGAEELVELELGVGTEEEEVGRRRRWGGGTKLETGTEGGTKTGGTKWRRR